MYDSKGNKLNQKVCSNISSNIYYTVNQKIGELAKEMHNDRIDIFDSKSNFYNDICYPYSKQKYDIPLKERRKLFY